MLKLSVWQAMYGDRGVVISRQGGGSVPFQYYLGMWVGGGGGFSLYTVTTDVPFQSEFGKILTYNGVHFLDFTAPL